MERIADPRRVVDPSGQRDFPTFFDRSWPGAFRLATFLAGDPTAGEEIAQDAMVGVYRNWHTLDSPDAYLRAAVVNRTRNAHRNRARHKAKLPLLFEADRVDFAAAELNDAVARLPFRQRAVLVMRYYLGLREAEIAEALGCRPGTVKSLASRALAKPATEVPR